MREEGNEGMRGALYPHCLCASVPLCLSASLPLSPIASLSHNTTISGCSPISASDLAISSR